MADKNSERAAPKWVDDQGDPDADQFETTCPRCEKVIQAAFYGPCEHCLSELRAAFAGEKRDVQDVAYEPKMNVTPNAVALKDD